MPYIINSLPATDFCWQWHTHKNVDRRIFIHAVSKKRIVLTHWSAKRGLYLNRNSFEWTSLWNALHFDPIPGQMLRLRFDVFFPPPFFSASSSSSRQSFYDDSTVTNTGYIQGRWIRWRCLKKEKKKHKKTHPNRHNINAGAFVW